jgi:hypothetical protein
MLKKWIPLESNPDVLNQFSSQLGLEVSNYTFHDIFGLDPVRHPCLSYWRCLLHLAVAHPYAEVASS